MTIRKCKRWPAVTPHDDGIRPAGSPDACFYCHSKVGEPHGTECAVVQQLVGYSVYAHGRQVGTYQRYEPHFWGFEECEFHKNGSTWCKDNALDAIKWTDEAVKTEAEAQSTDETCCCGLLRFEFREVIDAGPFVYELSTEEIAFHDGSRFTYKDVRP